MSNKAMLLILVCSFSFLQMDCNDDPPVMPPNNSDTTSHNFTWQTFTWGGGGASSINDVAIINDTNIWAVGEIQFTADSTYNAVHWNGHQWTFLNIPTERFGGTIGNSRLNTIIAFTPNDVWTFSIAGSFSHWDGMQWTTKFVPERSGSGTKFWGTSSSNLYLVGTNGSITYYNGSSWQNVESGTTLDIFDIWGERDSKTRQYEILAIAARAFQAPAQTELYRIQGTTVTKIFSRDDAFTTVWFQSNEKYYFGGNGMAWKNSLNDTAWNQYPYFLFTKYFISKIRGNGLNDIFSVGSFMEVAHYNGSTWYNYSNEISLGDGGFGALVTRDNNVVLGGQLGQHALLLIGKR